MKKNIKIEKSPLTKRQIEILNYIKKHINKYGYSPSIREICAGINVSSSATIHSHISNLVKKGWLKKGNSKSRALEIIGDNEYYNNKNKLLSLPLITDKNQINDNQDVEKVFLSTKIFDVNKESFLLKNKDDILIIKKIRGYSSNDKVVVNNKNGFTIKYYDNDNNVLGKIVATIKYEK